MYLRLSGSFKDILLLLQTAICTDVRVDVPVSCCCLLVLGASFKFRSAFLYFLEFVQLS